jgi:hypothetical protein
MFVFRFSINGSKLTQDVNCSCAHVTFVSDKILGGAVGTATGYVLDY